MNDVKMCRICLCLEDTAKHIPVFENKEYSEIAQKIFLISGVKVVECKDIPALICNSCAFELWNADKLRQRCIISDEHFRSIIPKQIYSENRRNSQALQEPNCKRQHVEFVVKNEYLQPDSHVKSEINGDGAENDDFDTIDQMNEHLNSPKIEEELPFQQNQATPDLKVRKYKRKTKYFCSQCFNCYTTSRRLKTHEYTSHSIIPAEAMLNCDLCKFKTKTKELMRRHIDRAHSSRARERYICRICGKSTTNKSNLNTHERTHILVDPSNYVNCPVCQKAFKDKSFMITHRKLVHDRIRTVQCPQCPHISSCKSSFDKHFKSIHQQLKDLVCSYCGIGFSRRDTLTRHITIHTGERAYSCRNEGCVRAYSTTKGRATHMKVCPLRKQSQTILN